MTFYENMRSIAHETITEFGQQGLVRRPDGSEHPVMLVMTNYRPTEADGQLIHYTDKRAYVSATNLTFEPEEREDLLIVDGLAHSIISAIPTAPAGTTVLWELQVRR